MIASRSLLALSIVCLIACVSKEAAVSSPPAPAAALSTPVPIVGGTALMASEAGPTAAPRDVERAIATALAYPYERMPTSYLYMNGKTYAYVKLGDDPLADGVIKLGDGTTTRVDAFLRAHLSEIGGKLPRGMKERAPVVGYGSNGAPSALDRKYGPSSFPRGWAVVPVLKGKLYDFEVVHAAHFYANGNLPATIQYAKGAVQETHVTMLDAEELAHMHATEGIDTTSKQSWYNYGRLSNIKLAVDDGPVMSAVEIYVDNYGAVALDGRTYALAAVAGETPSPKASQREILELAAKEVASVPETLDARRSCGSLTGLTRFVCASFASPCVRDARTAVLRGKKMFAPFRLPASSNITYEILAGTQVAGDPDALPASSRCLARR